MILRSTGNSDAKRAIPSTHDTLSLTIRDKSASGPALQKLPPQADKHRDASNNRQHPSLHERQTVKSQSFPSPLMLHDSSSSQILEQNVAISSEGSMTLTPSASLPVTLHTQPSSTQSGSTDQPSPLPALLTPLLTPKTQFLTASNVTDSGVVPTSSSCLEPLSPIASADPFALSLSTNIKIKRPLKEVLITYKSKRARRIIDDEDEDEDGQDAADNGNTWEDSNEDDDDEYHDSGDNNNDEEEEEEEEDVMTKGMAGYEKWLRNRDYRRFGDWIMEKLNDPAVYTILQASGRGEKAPKTIVYRRLAHLFNSHPPDNIVTFKQVSEMQVKAKITNTRAAFREAHKLRYSPGFESQSGTHWKKRLMRSCRYYFILEKNWTNAWAGDLPPYFGSQTSTKHHANMDNMPNHRCGKDKQRAVNYSQEDVKNTTVDLTGDDASLKAVRPSGAEDLENSGLSAAAEVVSTSTMLDRLRSASPGISRSLLAAVAKSTGHKDIGQLLLTGLEEDQKIQREKLALKREQFEFYKKETEEKNTLEYKKLELEDNRLREQQRLDHDFRVQQLKLNAELRNRGRDTIP